MKDVKARGPVEEKGPWNLVGFIPLGGPCGRGQVFRHYKAKLQVISSVDVVKNEDLNYRGLEWHLSVRTFPDLGPPDEEGMQMVREGFGLEGFTEDHNEKAAHFYLPVGDAAEA